jgi:hypothetical protein
LIYIDIFFALFVSSRLCGKREVTESQRPLDLSDLFLMSKIDKKTGGKRGELNKGMILESFCELVLNSL